MRGDGAPGRSPSRLTSGSAMPREFSVACCATRIFDAATIFMADVIFAMFCTDLMRSLTAAQTAMGVRRQLMQSATIQTDVTRVQHTVNAKHHNSSTPSTEPAHLLAERHGARPAPDLPCREHQSSMVRLRPRPK